MKNQAIATIRRHRTSIPGAFGEASRPVVSGPLTTLLASLVASATLTPRLQAADCRLEVSASPLVVQAGETAQVNVFARFPAAAYAFADAVFDVHASDPEWTYASSGVMGPTDVLGASFGQVHAPQIGQPANPSNPFRVWAGQFSPVSAAPALVAIEAQPLDFFYYPSSATPSAVPCAALPGKTWVFANPLYAGGFGAAPGWGTSVNFGPDGFVAEAEQDAILIGMLLPAVQSAREAAKVKVGFVRPPTRFSAEAMVDVEETTPESIAIPHKKVIYTFTPTDATTGVYALSADTQDDASTIGVELFRHGKRLAGFLAESGEPLLFTPQLPDTLTAESRTVRIGGYGSAQYQYANETIWTASHHGGANFAFGDGSVRFIRSVTEVRISFLAPPNDDRRARARVVAEVFEAEGAQAMTLRPSKR